MRGLVEVLLVLFVLLPVLGLALFVTGAVLVVRRLSAHWRRSSLEVRARLPTRSQPVDRLRRDLHRDLRSAGDAVRAGLAAGRPVEALVLPVRRLEGLAGELDLDLAVLAGEPQRGSRSALLAAQQDRVAALHACCSSVRRGVLLARPGGAALGRAVAEIEHEVQRLALVAQAHEDLWRRWPVAG